MTSLRSRSQRRIKPKDIEACRLCGGAIWLEPADKSSTYTSKQAWYHVARYPHIACAVPPRRKEPSRPLGAGP